MSWQGVAKGRFHRRVGGAGLMVKDRINQQCGCPFNDWLDDRGPQVKTFRN